VIEVGDRGTGELGYETGGIGWLLQEVAGQ
jgi:hypothetical protein